MLKYNVLQSLVAQVRALVRGSMRTAWHAVLWTVLGLVWAIGLITGLFRSQRELSPVAMLAGYAAVLGLVLGYGIVLSPREAPIDPHMQMSTTAASIAQLQPSAQPDLSIMRSLARRDLHESQHAQQVISIAQRAASRINAAIVGHDVAAQKPAIANANDAGTAKPVMAKKHECTGKDAFGPGRLITLDSQGGGEYGLVQFRNTVPLNDKEVVFTFDDGPHPARTPQVLDILDRYCIKAVFFLIGNMAERSPELVREIQRRGHTVGTHTWSHPLNLAFLSEQRAVDEIEHGFAAVSQAAGEPISPFFRFPGLGQSKRLLEHLRNRDIAVWSVDVVSGDSEGASAKRMPRLMMSRLERHGRGILLFHDIKKATIDALPNIIEMLRDEGYTTARVVPATPFSADPALIAKLTARRHQADLRYGRAKIR